MGTPGPFGAGSVLARAGTVRCGPRQRTPPPAVVGPKLLPIGLAPSGDRGSFGVGDALEAVSTVIWRKREQ